MIDTTNQVGSAVADPTILNEDTYNTLKKMFESRDEGDHKMGQVILTQLNVEKSIWWIYQLSRSYAHRMVNLRTKAGRKFRDESSLFGICQMSLHKFAKFLLRKDWLTPELYAKCKQNLYSSVKYALSDSTFFNVTVELKPEYKQYDVNDEPYKLI